MMADGGIVKTLHLPKKTNTAEKPWQNERGMGMAKGYKSASIMDSFAFYGRDISAERYKFYMRIVGTRRTVSLPGKGVINSGKTEAKELNQIEGAGGGGNGTA